MPNAPTPASPRKMRSISRLVFYVRNQYFGVFTRPVRSRPAVFHLVAVDRRHDFKSETDEEEDEDADADEGGGGSPSS